MVTLGNHDYLGYYLSGWKKFYNKDEALEYGSKNNFSVRWVFNDHIYKKLNWSATIEDSLEDLYKKRAMQLQDKDPVQIIVNEPGVYFDGNDYYCYFNDTLVKKYLYLDNLSTELFYCVHSIPELIVKYVQQIKEACIQDSNLKQKLIKDVQDNWSSTEYNKFYKI
jgi:hypothetical protein